MLPKVSYATDGLLFVVKNNLSVPVKTKGLAEGVLCSGWKLLGVLL